MAPPPLPNKNKKNTGVSPTAPEREAVPVSDKTNIVLLIGKVLQVIKERTNERKKKKNPFLFEDIL